MTLERDDWETNSLGSSEKRLAPEMATESLGVEGKSRKCRGVTTEAQDSGCEELTTPPQA